jgi:hypothetical protein
LSRVLALELVSEGLNPNMMEDEVEG